jgi:hypothetical protein
MGTAGSFPGANQPVREADHASPPTAEFKNEGAIPPVPQYVFTACVSIIKLRKFAFTLPNLNNILFTCNATSVKEVGISGWMVRLIPERARYSS